MTKKKVLIPTKLDKVARDILEKNGNYTVVQEDKTELLALAKQHPDAHAVIVRSEKVTAEIMDALPSLKIIMRAGSGYNTIDTKGARKRGIDVMNTPGANANAVAEEVIALMLADARHLVEADPSCRKGEWEKSKFMGREVTGKTVGIVGLGYIGQLVARRLGGFECKLLGFDPVISPEKARHFGIELVDLPTMFERCDYVTLHIPENSETKGLINYGLLSKMKQGATLVNCARAGVVVEADIRTAKAEKAIRYLNDVYPKDEPGPKTVLDIADIMVPHLGASTKEANSNAAKRAAEEIIEFDEKGITSYVVNRDIPEGLDRAYGELAYGLTKLCRQVVGKDLKLKRIETSIYGELGKYSSWLLVPITAALSEEFDRASDPKAAVKFLSDMGVEYVKRETDEGKGYGNSITVDLTGSVDAGTQKSASIRGTVAEGTIMISRINDFNKLYFEPKGCTLIFVFKDRPGVIGRIGAALEKASINIDDVRNPHDSKGELSIAILKVNKLVPEDVVKAIAKDIEAVTAFCAEL